MAWPTDNITTAQLDAATDSPTQARVELYTVALRVKDVIAGRNTASGVAPLDASSLLPLANIPAVLTGKDADTLDGLHGTGYARLAAASNFTTAPTIGGSTIWHASNDGAGSGLDADLLDGLHATGFARLAAASNFTTAPTISSNTVWHAGAVLQGPDGTFSAPAFSFSVSSGWGLWRSTTGPRLSIGSASYLEVATANGIKIVYPGGEPTQLFSVTNGSILGHAFLACGATGWNGSATAFRLGKNSITSRSLNAGGTVNASGADYAEYEHKAPGCAPVRKGDIVGFDSEGRITDRYAAAHSFGVKSTDPSYVGGDSWAVGEDDETVVETARQNVDRIAYAGKVPVNLKGATPGDYIVPLEAEDGSITAQAVAPGAIAFDAYRRAVGQVRRVLPDGRAEVSVKVL